MNIDGQSLSSAFKNGTVALLGEGAVQQCLFDPNSHPLDVRAVGDSKEING